eukprot:10613-Heterococcus_DN1.PRE.2
MLRLLNAGGTAAANNCFYYNNIHFAPQAFPLIYGGLGADVALHDIPQHMIPVPYCMPPQPYAVSDKPYVRGLVTVEKLAAKAAQQHLRAAAASEQYLRLCAEAEARGVQQALLEQYSLQQQYSQHQPEEVSDEEAEQDDVVELCDDTDNDLDEGEGEDDAIYTVNDVSDSVRQVVLIG